ncbi:MAG: hypothetical protein HN531_08885 [Opitutae bacterium]|nr:hypothetical protein [Opitutae bacterium]
MAIHWSSVTEPHTQYAHLETRWIAASLPLVVPRNDTSVEHRITFAGGKIECCHREGVARGDPL